MIRRQVLSPIVFVAYSFLPNISGGKVSYFFISLVLGPHP
jgi:hypothetical protein